MKNWNELSITDKNDIIKVAVQNGITTLPEIRERYNEFAEGGPTISDEEYHNRMKQVARENWRNWGYRNEEEAYQDQINNPTYDYRSFYANNPGAVNNAETHWPDTYKGALHHTFSDESVYNGKVNLVFNPSGIKGGRWTDKGYVPHGEQFAIPFNMLGEGGDTNGPRFQQSQEAYYDRDTDTVYAPDSIGEFYRHELFHARPDSVELERLKPYYDNLDDNRLLELGADLPFVKRMDNDPGHFYSPEEVGARVSAARYMLNNAGVNNVDNVFLEEVRKNENAYGNNFRDLLHMYNNENLIGIFGNGYSSGGKIHIKEKNRGKFTALKERTGHSASWFKAHGTPTQRKMATFELNARKWKHGDGGNLFYDGGPQESDNTRVQLGIVPNLPMDNSAESKFYRDLAMLSAMTNEERKTEDFYNRAHDTGTVAPTDVQARRGWMEVNPISGEAEWHAPTTVSAAPFTEGQRMWQSPAFQLALAPLFEAPFMLANAAKVAKGAVTNMANPLFKGSSFDSNLFERFLFENKLRGIEPIKGVGYPGDEYSITKGVSPMVKDRLMKNVVGRNVRELESEGFRPNAIKTYTKNLSDALDEVRVGRFSDGDFVKAGKGDAAGFYIDGDNFMAINRDATAFTDEYIQGHEGRHLMDYRQSLTNNQENILSNAYGDDFVNIPNTKYAEGLDDYANMVKEKVTTNHDARATLLGSKQDIFDIHAQDLVIDKTSDAKIFDAVERANGYGRRYIKYLRENNLLTPEKAQAFREAMKHVGGYVPWLFGIGATGYNYLNKDQGPIVEMAMGGKLFEDGGQYTVSRGDSLWKIAHENNMPLSRLRELNPQVKGNMIHPGDVLRLSPEFERQIVNLREERQREEVANMDNFTAIQAAPHDSNYVVVDKPNKKLQVYDRDNNLVYESSGVSFGKSGDDYNTITYVNANGSIRNNAGNNSTPAGISVITGVGSYHGLPSFTRGRINDDGTVENIASSIHYGNTEKKNMSNGCVRASSDTLKELSKYVGEGTTVYTLPEQKGSKFSVKNNKLNYTADNPFGMSEGPQRYWDDYNVRKDKSYSPLAIVYNGDNYDDEYNANVLSYTNALSINKEALQKRFNLSSDEYNRLAELAVGIAEQESKFGTSIRYKAKQRVPDEAIALAKNFKDSDSTSMFYAAGEALSKTIKGSTAPARSRGLTQIKIGGDNKEMQGIYKELGINENTINNPYTSALATLSRLAYMYNSEVKGRNFKGAGNAEVSPYDALLYKYMGRGSELKNKTATPDKNKYISNVKKYASDFDFLEERLVEKR